MSPVVPTTVTSRRDFLAMLLGVWMPALARGAETVALPQRGICAHRGGNAFPENTLPALREAVRLGVHMVEFDLAITRDGVLVLMHDRTVNRTTDGRGRVADFTLAQLKRLDAGAWKGARFVGTQVPTFADVLAELPRNLWINVDFKADTRFGSQSAVAARRAAETIVAARRLHQTVFAARMEDAAAAREVAPELLVCSMDRSKDPDEYVRTAIARRADFIQLRDCAHDARLPGWIAALKAALVRINYFYANDPSEVARLLAAGVDFVLVDAVETVLSQLPVLTLAVPPGR